MELITIIINDQTCMATNRHSLSVLEMSRQKSYSNKTIMLKKSLNIWKCIQVKKMNVLIQKYPF